MANKKFCDRCGKEIRFDLFADVSCGFTSGDKLLDLCAETIEIKKYKGTISMRQELCFECYYKLCEFLDLKGKKSKAVK